MTTQRHRSAGFKCVAPFSQGAGREGQLPHGAYLQPVAISGILADGVTLQLNVRDAPCMGLCSDLYCRAAPLAQVTWIPATSPPTRYPGILKYAFHDYPPAMPVMGVAGDLPAGPFNLTVVPAA